MYLKLGKIKIHITFAFAVFVAYICNVSAGERLTTAFVSAILHECVHLAFLIGYGCKGICVTLNPGGASIRCTGMELLEEKKQVAALLSAPLFNLILGTALFCTDKLWELEFLLSPAYINFALGAVNLLPLSFLDGGRALKVIAYRKSSPEKIQRLLSAAEYASVVLLCVGVLAVWLSGTNAVGLILFTAYCLIIVIRRQKTGGDKRV